MSTADLRTTVRAILDELDDDVRARIVDRLVARAAKAAAGWTPTPPSQRFVVEAQSFADAARRIGHADAEDVTEHLRRATRAFLAGDHSTARAVFEAILPPIASMEIDLGQHELVEEVLGIDAHMCVAQYVATVYTATPMRDRVDAILRTIEDVEGVATLSDPVKAMEDVMAGALPDLDAGKRALALGVFHSSGTIHRLPGRQPRCGGRGGSRRPLGRTSGGRVAHRRALEGELLRPVDEAIADRVGDAGLADRGMPGGRRPLARDEGGGAFAAVFDDFQEIAAFGIGERGEQLVVDRQEIEFGEPGEETRIRAVPATDRQVVEQPRRAHVGRREAMATRALDEGRREPGLPDPRRAGDQESVVVTDPRAGAQM